MRSTSRIQTWLWQIGYRIAREKCTGSVPDIISGLLSSILITSESTLGSHLGASTNV